MHQHLRSVTLRESQLAVQDGSRRTNGIAVLRRSGDGLVQAGNEVFDQLGQMSGTLTINKRKVIQFTGFLYPRQPVLDDNVRTMLEYLAHSLDRKSTRLNSSHLVI